VPLTATALVNCICYTIMKHASRSNILQGAVKKSTEHTTHVMPCVVEPHSACHGDGVQAFGCSPYSQAKLCQRVSQGLDALKAKQHPATALCTSPVYLLWVPSVLRASDADRSGQVGRTLGANLETNTFAVLVLETSTSICARDHHDSRYIAQLWLPACASPWQGGTCVGR
jgi:hypothetical protein